MSTFTVPVVKVGKIEKHPNADTLSVTHAEGCPVIIRTGDFQEGDLAIYVPVESVVPTDNAQFSFLATKEGQKTARIKAKKLRGIFSMGLLIKPPSGASELNSIPRIYEGLDLASWLGVTKYVEPDPPNMKLGGQRERYVDAHTAPVYDIESYRKYKDVLIEEEVVMITEKIHGCNGRFVFRKTEDEDVPRLFVGSRNYFIKKSEDAVWWKVAAKYDLEEKLSRYPDMVLYGEVYGQVQDLKYDTTQADPLRFAAFDIYDKNKGRFLDYPDFARICTELQIPRVPVLYGGPYSAGMVEELAQGNSVIADQIKEGVVIRPRFERWDPTLGRVILKLVGEQYLLRKGGTEYQ